MNALATSTFDAQKSKSKKPAQKETSKSKPAKTKDEATESGESYHFIGYVPAMGKVWELVGIQSIVFRVVIHFILDTAGRFESWSAGSRRARERRLKCRLDGYCSTCAEEEDEKVRRWS